MAFLQVRSNNPKLSFIIRKNPESGMIVRSLKQGRLFGYYSNNDSVFNCYFKDHEHEISYKKFKDEEWSYVNPSQHNAAEFVLDSINEFFAHVIKKDNSDDVEGFENSIFVNMMLVKKKYLEIFQKYFTNVKIDFTEVCPNNFSVTFSTKESFKTLFSFVQLFAMFNVLKNRRLDDAEINKYLSYLATIKAPFFVKYVFKVNVLRDISVFKQHVKSLEQNSFEDIKFQFGFASQQRIAAVEKELAFDKIVVDFGCGEGNFVKRFLPKMGEFVYIAIDKDPEMIETVKRRFAREMAEKPEHLLTTTSLLDLRQEHDIILSEVIEHMEKDEATSLVKQMLSSRWCKKVIITTPNKDFNQFYFFDDEEMRHDDHHFEMTKAEFEAWINEVKGERSARIIEIGDNVNGHSCSIGAVLE
jgi:2-polyprenyl-3-methyl-5-hydroxy-6-metoxy-1,4-benzoquinol methylase